MPLENIKLDEKFARLQDAIRRDNEGDVRDAIFSLGSLENDWIEVPDEVVERLLELLRDEEMHTSPYAGNILNFFDFICNKLSEHAKWLCIVFLNDHGDKFRDVYSQHMVFELRSGRYRDCLKMKRPNEEQWKDYQRMRGDSEKT